VAAGGWTARHLDDVDPLPWQGGELSWRPLRGQLSTRIVGMSVFTAERPGEAVIETHRESDDGRGQEEVYVVLRGAARFLLDGRRLDAPAGMFVRVSPEVERGAAAIEPGTAVLALGGPSTFEPSASEWIERARAHAREDPQGAENVVAELRRERPGSPGVQIAVALLAAARGEEERAGAILRELLAGHPELADPLLRDPDLGPILAAGATLRGTTEEAGRPAGRPGPPEGVELRAARTGDLERLLALLSQLYEGRPPLPGGPQARATLERILSDPARALLVAEGEGALLGTIDLVIVPDLTHGVWAAIENFVVDAGARRRGIGRALLGEAVELARRAGASKVQLVSHERRAEAHALYAAAGFDVPVRGFRRQL
jgi:ribosomal protein S18 acetylase RimI-like enzyme